MKDLHCHILPRMDDGAKNTNMRLRMMAMQQQGVDGIVFTPHFYRSHETVESFLRRRTASWEHLRQRL